MSLCVVLLDKENVFFGADSSISTVVNGEILRVTTNSRKISRCSNDIYYMCGKLENTTKVDLYYKKHKTDGLIEFLRENCNEKHNGYFDFEMVLWDDENKMVRVYSQSDNFVEKQYSQPQEGIQILCSGYKTEQATEVVKKYLAQNIHIHDVYVNTFQELVCNGIGGNVLISSNRDNNRLFPLIDNTPITQTDGLPLYIINAECLAGAMVIGQNLIAKSEDGIINIDGRLISIFNDKGEKKVEIGNYNSGKYGLALYSSTGNVIVSEDGILSQYQDSMADNVDFSNPLELRIFVPENTKSIYKAYLRFSLEKFRAYSRGAKSSPSQTKSTNSGGYSSSTTDSSPSRNRSTSDGGGDYVSTTTDVDDKWKAGSDGHNHGIDDGVRLAVYGGTVKVGSDYAVKRNDGESYVTWRESGQHTHDIRIEIPDHDHTFTIPSHDHDFEIPSHSHDFTIPSHSHDIDYGIYTSTQATNVRVFVNDKQRGTTYSSNVSHLDITDFLKIGTWNTIKLTSNQLGRISASVFIQSLVASF